VKSAVILISGRGSNMQALVGADTGADIRAVIANRGDAKGLERENRVIPVLKEWYAAQKRQRDEGLPGTGAQ